MRSAMLCRAVATRAFANALVARHCAAQSCRDREQRVEPTAGLIHALGDEIRRILFGKLITILEWVVPLRKRHRSRVEPCVDDFGRATHRARTARDAAMPRVV